MAQDLWAGLVGTVIGSVTAIVSSWITSLAKARSDEKARWQERQFRIEDQKREAQFRIEDQKREAQFRIEDQKGEAQKALDEDVAIEDKYWFDKSLRFSVIQSQIFRARGADELLKADEDLERFLEQTPEYLVGDNLNLFYLYCHSDFRQRHSAMEAEDSELQRFVRRLIDFKVPTGADIRKRRNDATTGYSPG